MNDVAVDYCLKQTKLETIFCTNNYLPKIAGMKAKGMGEFIKNVVLFDGISND